MGQDVLTKYNRIGPHVNGRYYPGGENLSEQLDVVARLRGLKAKYEAALGEGPGEAPGFAEDAQISLRSYDLVVKDALASGELDPQDLQAAGLPEHLEHSSLPEEGRSAQAGS